MTKTIDLNCDLGESYGSYTIGSDKEIIPLISSANVACGFHAGDPDVMMKTVEMVKDSQTTGLGAHPGFPDVQGFGRRYLDMTKDEVYNMVIYQIAALDGMARMHGLKLNHVKPHGALYNGTFTDYELGLAIARAVYDYNPDLKLMGLSGNNLVKAGEEVGLQVVHEVFADRAYEEDSTLVSRRKPGAMVTDTDLAVSRVVRMVTEGKVEAITGVDIPIKVDSICVHGDGVKALEFVQQIRKGLREEGIEIVTI